MNMERFVLMIIPAMICGLFLTGCDSNKEEPEKATGELYVIGAKSATVSADNKNDLVFTGDDVISYNVRYGEFIFSEAKLNEIISSLNLHTELHFFIGEKPVFDPPILIHYGWGLSNGDFDLQFRTDGQKILLTEWYMLVDSLPYAEREMKREEMAANKQKRKKELDILIKFLSEAGKITEHETSLPSDTLIAPIRPSCDKDVIVSDSLYTSAPNHAFEIADMKIEGNCLKIKFSTYECAGYSLNVQLIDSGVIAESIPPQRTLRLSIDSKEFCSAWITKEMSFNIEDLQVKGESRVQLNISGKGILYEY